jgi:hypothetical protein
MSRFTQLAVGVAGAWFVTYAAFSAWMSIFTQLPSMLLTIALLVCVVVGVIRVFTRWRHEHWRVFIPLFACAVAVYCAPQLGLSINRVIVRRSLPHYESIVRKIEAGTIPVSIEVQRVPQAEDLFTRPVFAHRDTNGVLTVEFFTENGYPAKHIGFLYCSSGVIDPDSRVARRWSWRTELKPLWFRVSN